MTLYGRGNNSHNQHQATGRMTAVTQVIFSTISPSNSFYQCRTPGSLRAEIPVCSWQGEECVAAVETI